MTSLQGENEPTFLFDRGRGGESTISLFLGFRRGLDEEPPFDVVFFMRGGMVIYEKPRFGEGKPKDLA